MNNTDTITTDTLRNGKTYTARYLQMEDLVTIMQLQEKVKHVLQNNANLQPLSKEEFINILSGNGFMTGIFIDTSLVGFRAMLIPELDDEHLGLDGGLSRHELSDVIYSEVSCVDPDFRGNGLQTIMGKMLFAQVNREQFRYICATVSPNNIPSMKDKLKLGMHIVALKEKYGGKMRYVMMKNLLHTERPLPDSTAPISMDDIAMQQRFLQDGYYGVDMMEAAGTWNIIYRKEKK